jgi:flavodoxin
MKTLIIYISIHHKNTEKIAKAMAEVLNAELLKSYEILKQVQNDKRGEVDIDSLSEYDLIGFGSGIYFGKHHKSLFKLAEKLPVFKGKKSFIFSTSGVNSWQNIINNILNRTLHFHNPLKKGLLEKGFNIIGEFDCRGWDTVGPFKLIGGISKNRPNRKDLNKAIDFAEKLKKII